MFSKREGDVGTPDLRKLSVMQILTATSTNTCKHCVRSGRVHRGLISLRKSVGRCAPSSDTKPDVTLGEGNIST
jgi:hypothetical protein